MATDWGNDDLVITAPQESWGGGDAVVGEWGAEDEAVPKSSYLRNLGSTAGKSAVTATGQAVGGIYRLADQLAALPQRIGIGAARAVGAIPQSEADLLNQLTDRGVRLTPVAANVRGASELAQISAGNIRSLADYYEPDPARAGEFSTQVAQAAGGLAPVLVSPATALPVLAGQFGEAERERAIAEGDSPEVADAKFTLGALGGGVLGAVPPLRVGGRPLVSAIGKIAGGAGINVAQDVAVQKLIEPNAPLDMDRVKFNAIFGALFGGAHAVPDVVVAVREISPRIAAKLGGAKTPAEASKMLREEAAKAAQAEAAILNDAAKAIDDKASGIYDFPDTGGIETPVDRLLKSRERAAQLAQARFEEAVQSLEEQLKRNQIGDAENIILEGTPAENQLLALDVKFGEGQGAVKERARLAQIISEERGVPIPETPREAQVAARLQGKTLEQQKQIIDQEIKLGKGTDPQSTQRKGLELKQNIETALDAQKLADEQAKAQVDAAKAQQKAIADQQKAVQQAQAEAAKPAEVPKSTQILQEQAKPPVLANAAAETASMTQGSPFALQGALNKLTSPPVETPAPVNIGPRDASVSTGTGKPTAKERKILAEQKRLIEEYQKQQGGQPNAIPEQIPNTRVLRPEGQEPKLNVELQGVGEGNAQAKLPARDQVRQGAVQESLKVREPLAKLSDQKLADLADQLGISTMDMKGDRLRTRIEINATPERIQNALDNPGQKIPRSTRGAVSPSVISPIAGSVAGAGAGYAVTDRQPGETEEEFKARRLRNTALGALAGASLLPFTRNIVRIAKKNANTVNALKSIQAEAIGSERMPEWYLKWRQRPGVVAVREAISNNRARVKDLVTKVAKDADVTNEQNPYLTGKLFPGRAAERVRQAEDVMRDVQKSIVEAGQASPLGVDEFIKRFNVWLEAKHTPYYNAALRRRAEDGEPITSRLTDAQAAEILADAGRDGYAPIFEELGKQYKDLTSATRKMLVDGGIISADTAAGWESTFPEYVPLNRILPEDSLETAVEKFLGGGPGMNVIGSGVYKIKGSDLQVADIGASIYANMLDAIRRVEKNRVDQAALNFFQGPGKNVPGIRITKPKFGEPFDENSQVAVRKNGERYVIEFQDPKLATAFSGLNSEGAGALLRLLAAPTRWISQAYTRFSPNFLAVNPLRDRQETALKLASQGDWGGALQHLSPRRVLFSDPKVVVDWFRKTGSPEAALFQQMLDDGGMAGGWASSTRKKAEAAMKEMRRAAPSGFIRGKDNFIKAVDFLTEVSEGSTRYRAYKRALDLGATRDEAALAARNASVDFNQKGTVTSQAAALYAFINPAIQGPINSAKALIRNPETIASVATAFIGLGAAADQWNQSFDEDWKKKRSMQYARNTGIPIIYGIDEKTGDLKFASLPVAYALRPIKSTMDFMWDSARGDVDSDNIGEELARVGAAIIDSTNPLGTSNYKTAPVPTFGRPLAEIYINEKFTGAPIVPPDLEADRLMDDRAKRFVSNNDTLTGRMANQLSDIAYETIGADISPNRLRYLISQYTGGPGRAIADVTNSLPQIKGLLAGDKDVPEFRASDFPVTSAFFRRVSPEISERETPEYKRTEEFVRKSKTEQELIRQQARLFYRDNVEQIAPENRVAFVQEADRYGYIPKDAAFRSTLLSKLRNGLRGRDETDNLISQLSVASGERAKYYAQRFAEMEPDEVGPFINEQMERGLLTPDVAAQLKVLSAQQSRN